MRKLIFAAAVLLLTPATPALADKYFAVTPSGATEMVFPGTAQKVVGQLTSRCIDSKWTVISSSQTELVCESPLNFGQSLLGQMLMGNSYSTPPRRFFRFNVAEVNGVSRVQASGWMELQMALGQIKRTDFSGPEFHNGMINFMAAAGGKLPVGTTFPNHVMLGVDSTPLAEGKRLKMLISRVHPDMPAAKAGLQPNDLVMRVAGKTFKSADWLDATAKAAETPTYEVEYVRAGKTMKVQLERAFRPTWSEAVVAEPVQVAAVSPAPAAPPPSVADELAKLAKLKSDGLLTTAEFDEQKRKLLAR